MIIQLKDKENDILYIYLPHIFENKMISLEYIINVNRSCYYQKQWGIWWDPTFTMTLLKNWTSQLWLNFFFNSEDKPIYI